MINPRRLSSMARNWRKLAARKKEKNSSKTIEKGMHFTVAAKGHFVVYTSDKGRYEIPLEYLKSNIIFIQLLRLSEEEFGLPKNGPITLHCDSQFLEYVVSLVGRDASEELEKAFLTSTVTCHRCC